MSVPATTVGVMLSKDECQKNPDSENHVYTFVDGWHKCIHCDKRMKYDALNREWS